MIRRRGAAGRNLARVEKPTLTHLQQIALAASVSSMAQVAESFGLQWHDN
jgi:hypothetical protein